jgi:hypothetical protein
MKLIIFITQILAKYIQKVLKKKSFFNAFRQFKHLFSNCLLATVV